MGGGEKGGEGGGRTDQHTMARPNRTNQRRQELIPVIARVFAELGYRRATTAELAGRCNVQENILYRLWPDKRSMFIAALEHVYDSSVAIWEGLLTSNGDGRSAAERLLEYESQHHGEFGMYRIVFAGLSEADDPAIRDALRRMYQRYQTFIVRRLVEHRDGGRTDADLSAWAMIGLGTITAIGRELDLIDPDQRRRLWDLPGRQLLEGC